MLARARRAALLTSPAGLGYAAAQLLGRRSGSRRHERALALPGDDLIPQPTVVTNHAITIDADPAEVWPWLTQMGYHRAGWYTYRWVDRLLFPGNWPSAEVLDPDLARPASRRRDSDGPADTAWFEVAHVEPARLLVLHSTTHVPMQWRNRYGAVIDWVWTFRLNPADGATRLLMRTRARTGPWWLTTGYVTVLVPADHLLATSMLTGIKQRVERAATPKIGGAELA